MKLSVYLPVLFIIMTVLSCGPAFEHNAAGFKKLNEEIINKFGKDAYYTSIGMNAAGDETQGYIVVLDKTQNKEDIRQEQWIYDAGQWSQGGIVNMQIDARTAGFYKFQLDKEVSLEKLGALIDSAKTRFVNERKGSNPVLQTAIANANNSVTDEATKYRYTVILKESGSMETHSYTYDREGRFMISN